MVAAGAILALLCGVVAAGILPARTAVPVAVAAAALGGAALTAGVAAPGGALVALAVGLAVGVAGARACRTKAALGRLITRR